MPESGPRIAGCDFSSRPTSRKPILIALGQRQGQRVTVQTFERLTSLEDFQQWLARPDDWVCAFDLPFGLPRELVQTLGWPLTWETCIRHYAAMSRAQIRDVFAAFCDARPVGGKFAHRRTDIPAGSSPSMKWVNPPVAYMLHAGVPLLLAAGIHLPGLHPGAADNRDAAGRPRRIGLEAYPGLLAREILARRSYKSDDSARQTPERLIARKDLITALEQGNTRLGFQLRLTHAQRDRLVDDASGDSLDAVLCLMQAAWAQRAAEQGDERWGLPATMDPLEGWILTA